MKRTISFLLSLAMLLATLSACGAATEPDQPNQPEQPEQLDASHASPYPPPASDVAKAISAAASDEPEDGPEILTDQLADYAEAAYGLSAEAWDDCAVLRAAGVRAYEIAVIYLPTYEEAERVEGILEDYLSARKGAFGGYAPEQAELVSNGKVCLEGGYFVGLFICEDSDAAAELFAEIIDSGVLPETEDEPEPTPEIDPSEEDMHTMWVLLMLSCLNEVNALRESGGEDTLVFPSYLENFPEMVEETYGLPAGQIESGMIYRVEPFDKLLFELVVFRMVDEDAVQTGMDALNAYWVGLHDKYSEWDGNTRVVTEENADAYSRVGGAYLCNSGKYLAFLLCENAEEANEAFRQAVTSIARSNTPAVTPIEQNPPEKITDDVFFVPVSWPDAEGWPDPDHPGRIKFTMPENEFMTLYDTSAIVSAWQSGDPSGLSGEDREIYDNAKEVLDEILREGMTDFEKEVEIYDWVLRNITYDYSHMDVLEETARAAYTPYGGLVYRAGVCLGYASAFQLLAELAGLECVTVIGAGQNSEEEHAWNMVRLNDEWYCVDATWDYSFYEAGMMNGREWRFFNATSDYFARTGHQWDYDNIPEATAEDHGYPG